MSAADSETQQIVTDAAQSLERALSAHLLDDWTLVLVRVRSSEWTARLSVRHAGAAAADDLEPVQIRLYDTTTTTDAPASREVDLRTLLLVRDEVMLDMLEQIVEALATPATRERSLARTRIQEALHWLHADASRRST